MPPQGCIMQQLTDFSPMQLARHYQQLKAGKTMAEVAAIVEKDVSHVSRYMALLRLPKEAQDAVDAGELAVRNAARNWAKKPTPKSLVLSEKVKAAYELVGEKVVITTAQMASFLECSEDAIRQRTGELESRGLLEAHKEVRPFVWRLTAGGAARLGKSFQRRWLSASAMHQYLMRNNIELSYRRSGVYNYLERVELWRLGFHPAVAEHVLITEKDGKPYRSLIIIDDYLMPLKQMGRRLARVHNPMKRYYTGEKRQWFNLIDRVVIFTTEEARVELHKKALRAELQHFEEMTKSAYGDTKEMKDKKRALRASREAITPLLKSAAVAYAPAVLEVR